jgi:hypothetical protein
MRRSDPDRRAATGAHALHARLENAWSLIRRGRRLAQLLIFPSAGRWRFSVSMTRKVPLTIEGPPPTVMLAMESRRETAGPWALPAFARCAQQDHGRFRKQLPAHANHKLAGRSLHAQSRKSPPVFTTCPLQQWGAQATCAPHPAAALTPTWSHLAGSLFHRLLFLLGILLLGRRVGVVWAGDGGQDDGRAERGDHGGENELLHVLSPFQRAPPKRSASCGCRDNPGKCRGAAGFVLIGTQSCRSGGITGNRCASNQGWRALASPAHLSTLPGGRISRRYRGGPSTTRISAIAAYGAPRRGKAAFRARAQARGPWRPSQRAPDLIRLAGCMSVRLEFTTWALPRRPWTGHGDESCGCAVGAPAHPTSYG